MIHITLEGDPTRSYELYGLVNRILAELGLPGAQELTITCHDHACDCAGATGRMSRKDGRYHIDVWYVGAPRDWLGWHTMFKVILRHELAHYAARVTHRPITEEMAEDFGWAFCDPWIRYEMEVMK